MSGPNERDEIAADQEALAEVLLAVDVTPAERAGMPFPAVAYLIEANAGDFADAILASDWLAERDRRTAATALRRFADSRGVNVGDEDDDYWRGYRQAQRECLHDAVNTADRIERGE